ncbi:MAG: trimethylamine methyltransferase family protein [Candidatus Thermoplasmatota archaeon]
MSFLDGSEVQRIHGTTMRILSEVGVLIHSPSARTLAEDAGAVPSKDGKRTLIPEQAVKWALASASKSVLLASRDGRHDIRIPSGRLHAANGGEGVFVRDLVKGESHSASSDDLRDFAVLVNELPEVDFFWPMVGSLEQPVHLKGMVELKTSLVHTTKHIQAMAADAAEAKWMTEMAAILTGGEDGLAKRPIVSAVECPISPLTFEKGLIEAQVELAKAGIPVVAMSASVAGLTSPVTLSGTIAQMNAENLASLFISQAARKGAPFIYSIDSSPGDLKTGSIDYGALEVPILRTGAGEMGRHYGLPTMVAGIGLENLTFNMVNEWEGVPHVSIQSMVPSDLGAGFGGVDMATGASLEQLVADAWVWGVAKEFSRDFDAGDQAISFETIRDAGIDGNFLGKRHTISRFRKEVIGSAIPKASLDVRMKPGAQGDLLRRAQAEAKRILAEPRAPLVTKDEAARMDQCMRRGR